MQLRGRILIVGFLFIQLKLSHGLQCYSCNSSEDENCATLKSNTQFKECDDSCAVWIEGTKTFRGCEGDVPAGVERLQYCTTKDCNKIIFPGNRIKCVKCSTEDEFCFSPTADLLYPCNNFVEDDSCYTYVINETSAIRGCLSDLDSDVKTCDEAGDNCIKCKDDFCNLLNGKSYVECVFCSSETDPTCGYTQDDSALVKLCEQLFGRENLCFAYGNQTHSLRGCLKDYPDLKLLCTENSEDCQICDDDACNSMKIIEQLCIVCDSSVDSDCRNLVGSKTPTLCGEGFVNKSGCYLSDKGGRVTRGCVTTLADKELRECEAGNDCKLCQGKTCNAKASFQKCHTCSSQDYPSCATLQSTLPEKVCDDYMDTCKVYVKPNSTTHRGCYKEMLGDGVECAPQTNNCQQCSDNNCNGEVFPANHLSCYHCEGPNTDHECYNSLESSNHLSHPCETFNFRDSCYFYITDKNVIHRGCLSDSVTASEMCQTNPDKCRTCQTSNCNVESVMKAPELACLTCDTTRGKDCNWGWPASSANKCLKERFFFENETCYILRVSDQTIRGCTLDGNVCRGSKRCELCSDSDACNRENTEQQSCFECSSKDNKNCGPEPFHTKNVTCPGVIQYDHRGCYTWVDADKNVKRGCFSDFTVDDRMKCLNDNENCERCVDEINCNDKAKDSAGGVVINFGLVIAVVVFHMMLF